MILKSALDAVVSVLFAAPCRICYKPLTNSSRIPICETCLAGFHRIVDPMCICCGRPFASQLLTRFAESKCRLCRSGFYAFDQARSYAVYDDALSEAILMLKYEEVTRLGDWFAGRLANVVSNGAVGWEADVIMPVPLHTDRKRERGYNQAELIARPLAKKLGVRIDSGCLKRTKPRPAQLVLSRTEHWKSVRGAYALTGDVNVHKQRVLLVDDVLTTGATLDSCSRVLKKAGAAVVYALTVGRVQMRFAATGSGKAIDKPTS